MTKAGRSTAERGTLCVLHLGKYFPPHAGGMETYLRDLMAAQQRRGHRVHALVHASQPRLCSREEALPHREQTLHVTRAGMLGTALFTPLSHAFPLQLMLALRRLSPQVLHLHLPNVSAFWVLLLPGMRRIPWVLHWHADVVSSPHSRGLRVFHGVYSLFEQRLLRRASAVICTSEVYRDSSSALRTHRRKCHVVPLGLDLEELDDHAPLAGCETPSAPERPPLQVLAVGRLTYYKGLSVLIEAMRLCEDARLRIVGTGELEQALQQQVADLALGQRVTFLGNLSSQQLAQEYASCDCLCLPSIERTEAFGLVLVEAMSHGKACIASDVPGSGIGWVVKHDVTGLLVPPQQAEPLADAINALASDRARLHTLGRNGRRRFHETLAITRSEAGVDRVYRLLASISPEENTTR